ncbi:MAG: helix-turn-helix transcriptional regulator [Elusimicrobia bacterium]|nr:helix-turn-helix transcriptional regulator [Elusimicrobiota bacterium]
MKRLRKERGWTQQKLAEKAGMSYVIITKIEQGVSKEPTILSMIKLANALGVSLDELVGRPVPRHPTN